MIQAFRFFLRLPFGQPPSLALARAARVLALDFTAPSSAPMLISFPQCGQFIAGQYPTERYYARGK